MKRVGHKGADHVAPGNTVASFEAALEHGVDMIEFDVLRLRDGRLVLAHGYDDAAKREPLALEEGLAHFAEDAYAGVELNVDLKLPGYEREVVEGLRRHGLTGRCLVSSNYIETMDRLGELEPELRRGWSYPLARRDYTKSPLAPLAYATVQVLKRRLPARVERMLRAGRFEALMAHFLFVTPRLVAAVRAAGGEIYVWTVDDERRIRRMEELGVDAVISNDPRLF